MASSSPMHLVFDLGKEVGMGWRENRPLHRPTIGQEWEILPDFGKLTQSGP